MKTANLSDAELTAYSGEHLLYELQYFRFTVGEIAGLISQAPWPLF